MRINRFLALCKVASRRKSEELVTGGKIKINGRVAVLADDVDPAKDTVEYNGKKLVIPDSYDYFILNKPTGVISAASDDRGRKVVTDFLPHGTHAVPVGRLDFDTTGVLLLTNDGELAYRLTHPSFGVRKIYRAKILGDFTPEKAEMMKSGIEINGEFMQAEAVSVTSKRGRISDVTVSLHEGKKREVKELFKALNCRVLELERFAFGNITCRGLKLGEIRRLTEEEVRYLYKLTGIS
ncbi:rRNA pseudouridine synthase [bacterium]|nr:rRNA pseudouridine synthase [bacterium]